MISTTWRKRIALWVTVIAVLTVFSIIVNQRESDAATPVGANQCKYIDWVWDIQEGSVNVDTARVDVTGRLCSNERGYVDKARTFIHMDIRETTVGTAAGYDYWKRDYFQVEDQTSIQSWRLLVGYKTCWVQKFDWVCGPTGRFSVNARFLDTQSQRPFLLDRWIVNSNDAAHARFS